MMAASIPYLELNLSFNLKTENYLNIGSVGTLLENRWSWYNVQDLIDSGEWWLGQCESRQKVILTPLSVPLWSVMKGNERDNWHVTRVPIQFNDNLDLNI